MDSGSGKARRRPKLERRNMAMHINLDAVTSASSLHPPIRTRSLDLSDRKSFRVDAEFEQISQTLGLSGPNDFAVPEAAWEARWIRSTNSDLYPISNLYLVDSPKPDPVENQNQPAAAEVRDSVLDTAAELTLSKSLTELLNRLRNRDSSATAAAEFTRRERAAAELRDGVRVSDSVMAELRDGVRVSDAVTLTELTRRERAAELCDNRDKVSDSVATVELNRAGLAGPSGGGGCVGIKGIRPLGLKPPPSMRVSVVDDGQGMRVSVVDDGRLTWDLFRDLAPESERENVQRKFDPCSSSSCDEDEENVELQAVAVEISESGGGCSFTTNDDDDSSNTTTGASSLYTPQLHDDNFSPVLQQQEFEAKLNLGTFPHSSAFKIYDASEIEAKQHPEKSNHFQEEKIKPNMRTFPYYRTVQLYELPEIEVPFQEGKAKEKLEPLEERVPFKVEYFPKSVEVADTNSSGISLPENSDVKESYADLEEKAGHADEGYESLPEHVKTPLLYCSLFPSHYEFRKDELVQMWIAEGFIQEFHGGIMEDTGSSYFNLLHKKGFFVPSRCDFRVDFDSVLSIPVYNPGNVLYKVNHMKLSDQRKTIPLVNYFVAEDAKFDGALEMTQHLSLICKNIDDMTFGVLTKFKHLCTLLLLSGCGSSIKHVPRDLFMRLKNLRTLNLSQTLISELPSSIRNAKSLRYLDLSNTPITRLPESIDSLQSLQTIKLRGCIHFLQLPRGMKKLINLRHIDLDIIRQLRSMSPHLGKLTHLQSLSAFLVGQEDGCRIGELNNLNALRGVLRISRLENVSSKEEAEEAALIDKKCLQRLELRWSNVCTEKAEEQEKILECLQPHAGLKELQIQQFAGSKLPTWISNPSLAELVILTLYRCKNCDLLPSIGQLPVLKSLSIIEMNGVKEINHQFLRDGQFDQMFHAFPKLEILEVDTMLNLKKWNEVGSGDFPALLKLTVDSCPELDTLPSLSGLKSLKHLELRRCPKLLSFPFHGLPTSLESLIVIECFELKERCLNSEGEDWKKICHVPSIWLDCEEVQPSNGPGRSSTLLTKAPAKTYFFDDINTSFAFKPHGELGSFFLGPTTQNPNIFLPPLERTSADPRAFDTVGGSTGDSPPVDEQPEEQGDQRGGGDSMVAGGDTASEDGYNWRI